MGLKFLMSFESSPGFFRSGVTISLLELGRDYTCRKTRAALTTNVISGTRSSRHCLVMEVGIGSSMQLFVGDFKMSSCISFSVTDSN